MINLNKEISLDYIELKLYKKEGNKKVLWCLYPDIHHIVRFLARHLLITENPSATMSTIQYEEIFANNVVMINKLIEEDKKKRGIS